MKSIGILKTIEVARFNEHLEEETPQGMLRWAWEHFEGRVAASSSFQTQSLPLLHVISRTVPEMPVLFLDTGFHFRETLEFRDQVVELLGLKLVNLRPVVSRDELRRRLGDHPFRTDPDACCRLNKIEPMERAAAGYDVLVSGVRGDQTALRADLPLLEAREKGPLRLHPMLRWTAGDIERYRTLHQLPAHPLSDMGYGSIGCAPCTRPVREGEDERAGRWPGLDKNECGLHDRGGNGHPIPGEHGVRTERPMESVAPRGVRGSNRPVDRSS